MRVPCLALLAVLSSGTAFAAAPIEDVPEKPAKPKKQINLDTVEVHSEVAKAVPIIIPRAPDAAKDVDTTSDHLLDATERH